MVAGFASSCSTPARVPHSGEGVKLARRLSDTSAMAGILPCVRVRPRTEHPAPGERPAAERYSVSVRVGILTEQGHTSGSVRDISVSGARIEHCGTRPNAGSRLQLGFAFYAHALPVPMQARVVRHTAEGGFAVEFENVDFRTQVLLRSLLPDVSSKDFPAGLAQKARTGKLELDLPPVLRAACGMAAERRELRLEDWIRERLEAAALEDLD